jgi:hypothetical protein
MSKKNKKTKNIQDQNPSRFRNLRVGQSNRAEVGQFSLGLAAKKTIEIAPDVALASRSEEWRISGIFDRRATKKTRR